MNLSVAAPDAVFLPEAEKLASYSRAVPTILSFSLFFSLCLCVCVAEVCVFVYL